MGWQRRWLADDAFINLRVVRQLLAGNGPVYNAGHRVESGTSALWIAVLALLDVITPFKLEWIAALGGLACTGAGLAFAIVGTRRLCAHRGGDEPAVPLGALVYVAVPVTWDYATSGLENGLSLLWIGATWAALCTLADERTPQVPHPLHFVLVGLGPLVRPDLGWVSLCFLVAAFRCVPTNRRVLLRNLTSAIALPVAFQVFRMGYYGVLVPNTAIAKEASRSHWTQGWWYLTDLLGPYLLVGPLLILLATFAPQFLRRGPEGNRRFGPASTLAAAALVASLGHTLFIIRVGGDFMHGRVLLPALLLVLLPVAVVRVVDWRWLSAAAIFGWALTCAVSLRPSYSSAHPAGESPRVIDAIDPDTKIADEREVSRRMSGHPHPVSLAEYNRHMWVRGARATLERLAVEPNSLVLDAFSNGTPQAVLPLANNDGRRGVIRVGALGLYGYSTPLDITVLDRFGLSDPISSHQRLRTRGRPGHEKDLPTAWVIAAQAAPGVALPKDVLAEDVLGARRSLQCADLLVLRRASQERLTLGSFLGNVVRSFANTGVRYSLDPVIAARELCS